MAVVVVFVIVVVIDDRDLWPWFNHIQVDALGHTLTPFWSVTSCHLCFLPI